MAVLAAVTLLTFSVGCTAPATLVGPPSDGHKPLSASTKNISAGDHVRVLLKSGEEVEGTILRYSREWIVLQTGKGAAAQERDIGGQEIRYIYGRRFSVLDTAAAVVTIGAGAVAIAAVLVYVALREYRVD